MKLPNLIKEAIFQATISLHELNEGKIYGSVLESHLFKLARYSKIELHQLRKSGNETFIKECREIFQEAKEAYEILRAYEAHGLEDEHVNRIRILLQRIMALEKLVAQQSQGMDRREFVRHGILATAASAFFGTRSFGAEVQATARTQVQQPRVGSKPVYYIIDMGYENSEFTRGVIQEEEALLEPAYVAFSSRFNKLSGSLGGYRSGGGAPLFEFLRNFYNEEIFKPSSQVLKAGGGLTEESRDPLPSSRYRLIILTTHDYVLELPDERKQKIKEVMTKRNIEIYVYGFLPAKVRYKSMDETRMSGEINMQQKSFLEIFDFATKVYTTPNLDRTEFRRIIQEWKQ